MKKRISYETAAPFIAAGADCRGSISDQIDTLKSRCRLLSGTDRIIVEMLLQGHCRYADLATLLGISQAALSGRARRLMALLGRQYTAYLDCHQQRSLQESKIARLIFLDRWTLRQVAEHTGLSLYRVRRIAQKLRKDAILSMKNAKTNAN